MAVTCFSTLVTVGMSSRVSLTDPPDQPPYAAILYQAQCAVTLQWTGDHVQSFKESATFFSSAGNFPIYNIYQWAHCGASPASLESCGGSWTYPRRWCCSQIFLLLWLYSFEFLLIWFKEWLLGYTSNPCVSWNPVTVLCATVTWEYVLHLWGRAIHHCSEDTSSWPVD